MTVIMIINSTMPAGINTHSKERGDESSESVLNPRLSAMKSRVETGAAAISRDAIKVAVKLSPVMGDV